MELFLLIVLIVTLASMLMDKYLKPINMKKYTLNGSEFNGLGINELQNNLSLWEKKIKYNLICGDFIKCDTKKDFIALEKKYDITIYLACSFYDRTCQSEWSEQELFDYIVDEFGLFGLDIRASFDRALYQNLKEDIGEWKQQGPSKLVDIPVDEDEPVRSDVTASYFTFN